MTAVASVTKTIFSDTINITVKLCMMIILVELYPFIPLSVTWNKLKLCIIVDYVKYIIHTSLFFPFFFGTCSREITDNFLI